jgi:hypothetical protein
MLHGSCLCGGVRFEVDEPFERVVYCHCASCKKLSGGGATANGRAKRESIRIVAGEDLLRTYQPDEGTTKTFCSVCGSNLFGGGWPERPFASVRLTTIEEPFDEKPSAHIFVRSLARWETLPDDGTKRFDTTSS